MRSSLPALSEIDLFQLHLGIPCLEERVLKNLHDVLSGPVEVVPKLFLGHHLIRGLALAGGACLNPGQKLLVLFLGFKGIEDVGLLAEEAIDWGGSAAVPERVRHLLEQ